MSKYKYAHMNRYRIKLRIKYNKWNYDDYQNNQYILKYFDDIWSLKYLLFCTKISASLLFMDLCWFGYQHKAKLMIQYGHETNSAIDIHIEEDYPIQLMCINGHIEMVKWLMDYGMKIDSQINIRSSNDLAFRLASRNNHSDIVELLISVYPNIYPIIC